MVIATVVDCVWGTKKHPALTGQRLLLVSPQSRSGPYFVAVDCVGAGTGETVLGSQGSAARTAVGETCPVDAAIVGILDEKEG